MIANITGGVLPLLTLNLNEGEEIYSESGRMSWMTSSISLDTSAKGGFFKSIGRMFSGETLFLNKFKCTKMPGKIAFGATFPGSIMEFDLANNQNIICQKGSFLCAESSVTLSTYLNKKLGSGFFGGEGFIMQKIQGPGKAYLEFDGFVQPLDIPAGVQLKVDPGKVAAIEESVTMDIEMVKGFKNFFFGGEGAFFTTLTGPGRVYLQSMTIQEFEKLIEPYIPHEIDYDNDDDNDDDNDNDNDNDDDDDDDDYDDDDDDYDDNDDKGGFFSSFFGGDDDDNDDDDDDDNDDDDDDFDFDFDDDDD